MWIKKIIYKINDENRILDNLSNNEINFIIGKSDSGKTFILNGISNTWKNVIDNKLKLEEDIKFEIRHNNEIMSCPEERSNISIKNIFFSKNNDVSCGILYYPSQRISYDFFDKKSTTEKSFMPIENDFKSHSIHNSIILIDDIDIKPNKEKIESFINKEIPLMLHNRNQIIISIYDDKLISNINIPNKKFYLP
jgi:hypothetical protein